MRSAQSSLSVDLQDEGPTVVLRLDGEIDITSSPLLQAFVDQALVNRRDPACRRLVVDMSGVAFADASGISPLLMARAVLSRRGGSVELRHCRRAVLRLLRVLGVDDMLAVEERTVG